MGGVAWKEFCGNSEDGYICVIYENMGSKVKKLLIGGVPARVLKC